MKINKLNYEAYAIDYLEGSLSAEDRKDFDAFLKQNPSVKQELDDYLEAPIMEDVGNETFASKDAVKQKAGIRKGVVFILLLLLGIFALGIRIGVNSQPTEVPTASEPVQKSDTRGKSMQMDGKTFIEPKYMAEQRAPEKRPAEEKPVVETKVQKTIASISTPQPSTFTDAKENDSPIKEIATTLSSLKEVSATSTDNLKSSTLGRRALAKAMNPQLATVETLSTGVVRNPKVASLLKKGQVTDREPVIETAIAYEPTEKTLSKKSRWLRMLTPQSYQNMELQNTIAIANLKPAVKEIEEAIVPEILITK